MTQSSTPSASLSALHSRGGALGAGSTHGVGSPAAAQPLHATPQGQAPFRLNIRRSLQLHRRLALVMALAGIALSLLYFFRLWPQYLAQSRIYVQPASPMVLQGGAPEFLYARSAYESFLQQRMKTVTRQDVLENALRTLPPGVWRKSGESDQAAAARLGHAIQVDRSGAYQFTIGGRASNPELAAELSNAVTSSYIGSAPRGENAGDAQRIAALRQERSLIGDQLNADNKEQAALIKQLGAPAAGSASSKLQRTSDLAADITRLQSRYAEIEDQLHNQMLEERAPGAVILVSAAVPPLEPVRSSVAGNTLILILASIVFGVLVVAARHKMDPKLYAAPEVKQVLGFAPTVQLPDFTEVPAAVGEECLMRLAAAIEHARKQGRLKRCVFTGTAPGVGVTTVVTKLRDMLEAMGRPAMLVNASGTPAEAARAATAEEEVEVHTGSERAGVERGGRSTAMPRQAPEEAGMKDESLVFTDTAPLEMSAETENLARVADCVIVVMEAGATTREQLRATTQILQRLNVGTVGYVLNRVSLAKADRAFRQSVRAMERRARSQRRPTQASTGTARTGAIRTAGSRHLEDEPWPAAEQETGEAAAPAPPEQAAPTAEVVAGRAAHAEPGWAGVAAPAPLPPPTAKTHEAPKALPPAPEPSTDMPWWLSETSRQTPAPAAEILRQLAKIQQAGGGGAKVAQQPAPGEASDAATSRLSGLRNILYLRGISDMKRAREEAAKDQGTVAPEMEPWRPGFSMNRAREGAAKDQGTVAPEMEPWRPGFSRNFVTFPEPVPAASAAPRDVMAAPEILSPKPAARSTDKRPPGKNEPRGRLDRRDTYDEVAILPSWRGQYRRGDYRRGD